MGKMREFFRYKNVEIPPFFAVGFLLVFGVFFVESISLLYVLIYALARDVLDQIHWDMIGWTLLVACPLIMTGMYLIHASKRGRRAIEQEKQYFTVIMRVVSIAIIDISLIAGVIYLAIKFWPALPR